MITYALFLSSVFLLSFVGNSVRTKNNKLFLLIILYATILSFLAFRYYVGWDYYAYDRAILGDSYYAVVKKQEFLSYALVGLSQRTGSSFLFFLVNALVSISFVFLTVKDNSQNLWASLIIFVCFPLFYLNSFSVVRFFTALSISFFAFTFIKKKKILPYFLFVILASGFHLTALICLPFYFFSKIKTKTYVYLIIAVVLIIFKYLFFQLIDAYFPQYISYLSETESQEGTKAIFFFVVLLVVFFVLIHYRKDFYQENYRAFNLFYFGVLLYIMFLRQGTLGHRLSLFGTIYSVFLIPNAISFSKRIDKRLLYSAVFVFCVSAFVYTILVGSETYLPYKTIWSK